jgi:hypothetical protein
MAPPTKPCTAAVARLERAADAIHDVVAVAEEIEHGQEHDYQGEEETRDVAQNYADFSSEISGGDLSVTMEQVIQILGALSRNVRLYGCPCLVGPGEASCRELLLN